MTHLYVTKLISIGTLMSGLLTGSGLGILMLFKTNKNKKENIIIVIAIIIIGVLVGSILDLIV
jgi:predicted membrane-bound spermidine synthase